MTPATLRTLAVVALLEGCGGVPDAPDLVDTGWFPADDGLCEAVVQSTVPADGDVDWYWRDPLTVLVGQQGGAYDVRLVDDTGAEVPITVSPDESGLRLVVTPARGLAPSRLHRLQLTDCRGAREVTFTTSALGLPLQGGVDALKGRTWLLDLVHADIVQPPGFGAVLAGLSSQPPLIGATFVDERYLDLLGAIGRPGGDVVAQDTNWPTWDLPLGDFDGAPYFEAHADSVTWFIADWPLPIEDFFVSGTFAPDGSSIGGMVLTGLIDTRGVGGAIGKEGDEGALCAFVGGLGVSCVPCGDDEPYCLVAEARALRGIEQRGVRIVPVIPE